ncbi:MAG TPA: T9SS type A sorting domain-containing protein [Bacteroidia bacterium]|jgi:hypothetical protein|nr:T9SS type A sorting domain-containing protein [Bacteroidia bacterium]HQK97078.1 T9SS type A sorting domain-containing protein [Bacteroidia bacterium]
MFRLKILALSIFISFTAIAQIPTCQWAYAPVSPSSFFALVYAADVDSYGNIIQAGRIYGVADMNPASGPGDTSYSYPTGNYYLSKTTSSGNLIWIKYFRGVPSISTFEIKQLKVNSNDEIVVLGNYLGLVDFDFSSSSVDTLRSHQQTYDDYFVAKYNSNADLMWVFSIGDAAHQTQVKTMTLNNNNDILVATNNNGAVDLDPGVGVALSLGGNANLVAYNSSGNYLWHNNIAVLFSYAEYSNTLATDALGNAYLLTEGYYEMTVNKFDNVGNRLYNKTIGQFSSGARVLPKSIWIDPATQNYYICGSFQGSVNFDPNGGSTILTCSSVNYQDGFIAKYDSSMNVIWVKQYTGQVTFGKNSIAPYGGNILLAGDITGTANLGGANNFNSTTTSPFMMQIDTLGNTQMAFVLAGMGGMNTINITPDLKIVTTGYISGNIDMDPTAVSIPLSSSNTTTFNAVYFTSIAGMSQLMKNEELLIYPNPTNDFIQIQFANPVNANVSIIDGLGRTVASHQILNESQDVFSVKDLNAGLYYVLMTTNGSKKAIKKFIIQ